jgi:hypothetical protein
VTGHEHTVERDGETLLLNLAEEGCCGTADAKPAGSLAIAAPRARPGVLVTTWTDIADV